jgi:hypothetical protein
MSAPVLNDLAWNDVTTMIDGLWLIMSKSRMRRSNPGMYASILSKGLIEVWKNNRSGMEMSSATMAP